MITAAPSENSILSHRIQRWVQTLQSHPELPSQNLITSSSSVPFLPKRLGNQTSSGGRLTASVREPFREGLKVPVLAPRGLQLEEVPDNSSWWQSSPFQSATPFLPHPFWAWRCCQLAGVAEGWCRGECVFCRATTGLPSGQLTQLWAVSCGTPKNSTGRWLTPTNGTSFRVKIKPSKQYVPPKDETHEIRRNHLFPDLQDDRPWHHWYAESIHDGESMSSVMTKHPKFLSGLCTGCVNMLHQCPDPSLRG
jgi:hypothetical protein